MRPIWKLRTRPYDGAKLRNLRISRGLSLLRLSAAIDCGHTTIRNAEHGHELQLSLALRLAAYFGVTVEEIWCSASDTQCDLPPESAPNEQPSLESRHNEEPKNTRRLLTVKEVAERLAMSVSCVYQLLNAGVLRRIIFPGSGNRMNHRVSESDLDAFIEAHTTDGSTAPETKGVA